MIGEVTPIPYVSMHVSLRQAGRKESSTTQELIISTYAYAEAQQQLGTGPNHFCARSTIMGERKASVQDRHVAKT